jgi:hypothetical protein
LCVIFFVFFVQIFSESVMLDHLDYLAILNQENPLSRPLKSHFSLIKFKFKLTNKFLYKKSDGNDVKDKQVENILPVFLQESGKGVPLTHNPHPTPIVHLRIYVEGRHSVKNNCLTNRSGTKNETQNYLATLVEVSRKFCLAPLQSRPMATKSPLYSFIITLKSW